MSKIEVNEIDKTSGSTLTLGGSGTAVTLACGATQTGFGREGSVNWQTTPKTATFTAVSGEGYFINQGSQITMNLPAGSAGAIVAVSDYARNFATYNLLVSPNGSEKIGGVAADAKLTVNGQASTFVYVDSTKGWINVQNAEDTVTSATFISATGGTITTACTDFKVHTFTSPGTFCVASIGSSAANNEVSYVVVAGGGAGNAHFGGGGGAGGFRESKSGVDTYTASPLEGSTNITVAASPYPVTIGAGGAIAPTCAVGGSGSPSSFAAPSTITSAGGGGGGKGASPTISPGIAGGSGGGGGAPSPGVSGGPGGAGNTPPVSPPQGNTGGTGDRDPSTHTHGGGGGGATAVGANAAFPIPANPGSGNGGAGATTSITGSAVARGGGGGGATNTPGPIPSGGAGGGGAGGTCRSPETAAVSGTANTGGGGGGTASPVSAGAGGSGVVIIRYKFQ